MNLSFLSPQKTCWEFAVPAFRLMAGLALVACFQVTTATAQVRSYDGSGNNLGQPTAGAADEAFARLVASQYADGISAPAGTNRPNPRLVSNATNQNLTTATSQRNLTSMVWQWGQFIDHDMALTLTTSDLFSIPVASGDILSPSIHLTRSEFDATTGVSTPRQQVNSTTSYLDASMVYGSSLARANELRTMSGGMLKTSSGNLLPFNVNGFDNANDTGVFQADELYLAGDVRANEQPGLTAMHTLFVREHNRLATEFSTANPSWTDEQIYQHARRTVAGIVQSITYNEFLPTTIGGFTPTISQYQPNVDATLSNEFATAAFRFGHTMVTDHLLQTTNGAVTGSIDLADGFFDPTHVSAGTDVDSILGGLQIQIQNATDLEVVEDLRSMLFGPAGAGGLDLLALNIQRGRDHGLSGYSDLAAAFGHAPISSIADLTSDPDVLAALGGLYSDVDEMDLWVGLLAADTVPGTEFGLLLNEILSDQFQRLMEGDRFFFAWDEGLSELERQQIMDTRLSDVIARNTDLSVRSNVFVIAIPEPTLLPLLVATCGGLLSSRRRRF